MKWKTTAALLSATTFIAFGGALAGTLAWYSYATRASLSYGGTSVYSTEQLQMGLRTENDLSLVDGDIEDYFDLDSSLSTSNINYYTVKSSVNDTNYYQMVEKTSVDADGKTKVDERYWFTLPGTGLGSDEIDGYLKKVSTSYAKTLIPVTTRSFENNDSSEFKLYSSPAKGEDDRGEAADYSYSKIPFAFRVVSSNGEYKKNQNVWIVDVNEKISTESATKALRLYFEGESNILFNPSSKTDGSTTVAGLLDLDKDGYYDVKNFSYETGNGTEYIYGLFDNQPNADTTFDSDMSGHASDVNSYYDSSEDEAKMEPNSFYAKHKQGDKGFTSLPSDLPVAKYAGTNTVYPNDNAGSLTKGSVLSKTSDDDLAIGTLDMTIYMEGWDHGVIDKYCEYQFDLGLTFQINKVD